MSRSRLMVHSLTAAVVFAALFNAGTTAIAAATESPSPVRVAADATGAGGIRHYDLVLPGDTDGYQIRFVGGQDATIIVDGDRSTDLDCRVYDSAGNLVASDTDPTDYCVLQWHQWVSGPIRLTIENLGDVSNYYELSTN